MIVSEQFREDLFFRLNTFEIHLPPLRERKADIPALAQHMLSRFAGRRGGHPPQLTEDAVESLQAHDWPGNIRELANAIERAMILSGGQPICPEHLPTQLPVRRSATQNLSSPAVNGPHFAIPEGSPTLRDIEMKYIQVVLEKHHGNKPAASRELGISLKTLYNKINQLQQT
jgi:DNA-binding NtrC family response regulator